MFCKSFFEISEKKHDRPTSPKQFHTIPQLVKKPKKKIIVDEIDGLREIRFRRLIKKKMQKS